MARPQISDGGDGLHIWRVAANMLNKQSKTSSKDDPPARGLGAWLTMPHCRKKKKSFLQNVTKAVVLAKILWINGLS